MADTIAKSPSQTARASEILREKILANELAPGSNHLEAELAEMLGMSRTPVREAALVLQAQGLVEMRPRHGVFIRPLEASDMEEIYQILTELEALAAYEVAKAGVSEKQLDALEATIARMEASLEDEDRLGWAEADKDFHQLLVDMAGNERLKSIVSTYNDQVHRARLLTLYIRPAPHKSNKDHHALFLAIKQGDADKARELHRQHRIEAKDMMIRLLQEHGFHKI